MPSFHPLFNASVDPFELPKFISLTKDGLNKYETVSNVQDIKASASNYFNNIVSIPQNQSSITFGETFQFYLQCSNDSEQSVYNVNFIIEFRSAKGKKFTLVNTSNNPVKELEPNKTIDYSFHYRVEDPIFYYLSCKVNYMMGTGKSLILKKMFKLQVNNAFNPRINVQPFGEGVIVVADIMNLISSPLHIESVKLTTNGNYYSAIDLNRKQDQSPYDSSYIHELLLNPNDAKLYTFYIQKHDGLEEIDEYNQNIGHLTITWRNHFGEMGYQKSDDIHMISFAKVNPVLLKLKELPQKIKIYEPFKVSFTVHNKLSKSIRPLIKSMPSSEFNIKIYGQSRMNLPNIKKGGSYDFEMEFIALESGIQSIGGLSLTDTKRMKLYNFKSIVDVVVEGT